MSHPVTFLHTSPAAIPPLMQYFAALSPDLEITNILEDGLLRLIANGRLEEVRARLLDMLDAARQTYHAELLMLTCSAVPASIVRELRATAGVPFLKIDEPMAEAAVQAGDRLGVVITNAPTWDPTSRLLYDAATSVGKSVELIPQIMPEAYGALLNGDSATHDRMLLEGIDDLVQQKVDAIVLAQVSMARLLPHIRPDLGVPVFSSLSTSHAAIRRLLDAQYSKA